MPQYDQTQAELLVFTFKEGLLSRVAHDLKLRLDRFVVDVAQDRSTVSATFDMRSLAVVCAVKDGVDKPRKLSEKDRRDILKNTDADVLFTQRFPEARFQSRSVMTARGGWIITGPLSLVGKTRDVTVFVRKAGPRFVIEARLHQPDWGIRPFSAMMGAIKIKPDVNVQLTVPST